MELNPFKTCRMCYNSDDWRVMSSIFDENGYWRTLFMEKFNITFNRYIFDKNKVILCHLCRIYIQNSTDEELEMNKIKEILGSNQKKHYDAAEMKYFKCNTPTSKENMEKFFYKRIPPKKTQYAERVLEIAANKVRTKPAQSSNIEISTKSSNHRASMRIKLEIANRANQNVPKLKLTGMPKEKPKSSESARPKKTIMNLKNHKCRRCSKSYALKSSLRRHISKVHARAAAKRFLCNVCEGLYD